MIDLAVVVAALVAWFLIYAMCRVATRPALPDPAPATMDLGGESPALVSLLVNRWSLTEDAAESTLLDLAARKFFELRQPGNDPSQTTVHVPAAGPAASGLRPYESQVLERIRGLAVGGVVPITALTFRDEGESKSWNSRLRSAVIAEARAAGLSRRRFGKVVVTLLVVAAALAGLVIALAAVHYGVGRADDDRPGFGAGVLAFFLLAAIGGRSPGERDTPAGREVAARWLGVRDWLRGHEQFAELPPAAVAVWDRYLGYGAAVGATRLASAVLDLEMGNRKLVWSSFGGTWHRVRVRYPSFWPRYGRTVGHLVVRGLITAAVGGVAIRLFPRLFLPAVLILLFGVYLLIRALVDLAATREITGEVLWRENWKSRGGGEDQPPVPWLDYLAVDDGSADRTTAWGVPVGADWSCRDGDTVTITVRPWSRRVAGLAVTGRGRAREVTSTVEATAEDTADLAQQMGSAPAPTLISADDVSQMFGRPVTAQPFPTGMQFRAADNGKPLLLVQVVSGLPGRVVWRANSRGVQHPSGGYVDGDRAAFRTGDQTVVMHLTGEGKVARGALPWLIERASRGTDRVP